MSDYVVKVTGDREFFLPADGTPFFSAICKKEPNGDYKFEYRYYAYIKGGGDTEKEMRTASAILKPDKIVVIPFTELKYEYIRGCFNKFASLMVKLMTIEEAYFSIPKKLSYPYGYVLAKLGKEEEFLKSLKDCEDAETPGWSIYDNDKYAMLSLAYRFGIGKQKDERMAALNAFRSGVISLIYHSLEMGFGKETIKDRAYYEAEIEGVSSHANYYLCGNALIEEGFKEAGEAKILFAAECNDPSNDYGLYNEGNEKAWYYQALINKQAAEILMARGKSVSSVSEPYAYYLAYKKNGNLSGFYVKTWENYGDRYDSDWHEVVGLNRELVKSLISEAADNGDAFAKSLLS